MNPHRTMRFAFILVAIAGLSACNVPLIPLI